MDRPLIMPDYVPEFTCIADRCSLTCCQEWRIHVDPDTEQRWQGHSLCGTLLTDRIMTESDGNRIIRLGEDHLCPFLDPRGLCRLVLEHGEAFISDTCHLFPRQSRRFEDREEHTLLTGCPVVMDLLRAQKEFRLIVQSDPVQSASRDADDDRIPNEDDRLSPDMILDEDDRLTPNMILNEDDRLTLTALRRVRSSILKVLQDPAFTPREAMLVCFHLLLELWEYEPEPGEALEIIESMSDREALLQLAAEIRKLPVSVDDHLSECNELFLDLSRNYDREQRYEAFLRPLTARAKKAAEIPGLLTENKTPCDGSSHPLDKGSEYRDRGRTCDPEDHLLRMYLCSEVFSHLISDTPDLDNMLLHFQWIAMTASAILHACRLSRTDEGPLSYEQIRDCFCILTRMTGCDDRDMAAYTRDMFDGLRWEWGYMALIL